MTISHLEYLHDDVLSWQFSCVLPWIFSSLCCHVVFGTGRWRRAVLASERERERVASFLFTAPVCGVICSLVGLSVSENSSDAPCGCVMAGTSQGLGGVATTTTHSTPAPHHQCVVSKVVTPQGSADEMCCTGKEVVVDAYQSSNISLWWICEVSVRVAFEYFCPSN